MNLEKRILQSLRPRREGVLLRSDVNHFGSASQVSVALKSLLGKGLIAKLDRGVFAKPEKLLQCGAATLHKQAQVKKQKQRALARKRVNKVLKSPTAIYVRQLANREGIVFAPTYADIWATAITQLAGDEVKSDPTDDLLVALTRAGKLSPREMTKLVIAHHRNLASKFQEKTG
jgi:hypothetical protein